MTSAISSFKSVGGRRKGMSEANDRLPVHPSPFLSGGSELAAREQKYWRCRSGWLGEDFKRVGGPRWTTEAKSYNIGHLKFFRSKTPERFWAAALRLFMRAGVLVKQGSSVPKSGEKLDKCQVVDGYLWNKLPLPPGVSIRC